MLTIFLASILTLVQLNCENLFDCSHDEGKNDTEFTPEGKRLWTQRKYRQKTENIAKELIGCCGKDTLPDLITLCEIENDSVMERLTQRTALGQLGYRYIMTNSRDERGIDVAIIYNTMSFRPISHQSIRPDDNHPEHPLRDILYVCGSLASGDTLHVVAVHAPSKFGGEKKSLKRRMVVMEKTVEIIDSIRHTNRDAKIIIAGDFNDTADSKAMTYLEGHGLMNVTKHACGKHGAQGSYKYKGKWESIDHILIGENMRHRVITADIYDNPFLLSKDKKYGGYKPYRSFNGFRYAPDGYSDHLPVVIKYLKTPSIKNEGTFDKQ